MVIDQPGKRDRQVTIQQPTETVSDGKITRTWADLRKVWVQVAPLLGREYWEAKQQASTATHKVTGQYFDFEDVTADYRLALGSRTFNLLEKPRDLEDSHVIVEMMVEEEGR